MPFTIIRPRVERSPDPAHESLSSAAAHRRPRRERRLWLGALLGAALCVLLSASPASAASQTLSSGESGVLGTADANTGLTPGGPKAIITNTQPPGGGLSPLIQAQFGSAMYVSTQASGLSAPFQQLPKTYTYTRTFELPTCTLAKRVSGDAVADDTLEILLNGVPVAPPVGLNSPLTFSQSTGLVAGTNTLSFVVTDVQMTDFTALAYHVTVDWDVCGEPEQTGIVKVCKVAGPGVPVGTQVPFTIPGTPKKTLSVPAGPGPGGFCKQFPDPIAVGSLTITEEIPAGNDITDIQVLSGNPSQTDAQAGTATITVGPGVSEVVFTNAGRGYMEICKDTVPVNTTQLFDFMIYPAGGTPFPFTNLPGGSTCTPPLWVTAGPVKVVETGVANWFNPSCWTVASPTPRPYTCGPALTATTSIVPPGISEQVLLYFRNCRKSAVLNPKCQTEVVDQGTGVINPKIKGLKKFPPGIKVVAASPDQSGKTVVYVLKDRTGKMGIYAMRPGSRLRKLPLSGALQNPQAIAVSEDGRIFVADRRGVVVVPNAGGKAQVMAATAGSTPQGLVIQTIKGRELLVFAGKNPADRKAAVMSLDTAGDEKLTVLAKAPQVHHPDAIAVSTAGPAYVMDGSRIVKIDDGRTSRVPGRLKLGDDASIALTASEFELVISTLSREGTPQLTMKHLTTGKVRSIKLPGVSRVASLVRAGHAFDMIVADARGLQTFSPGGTVTGKAAPVKGSVKTKG